MNGRRAPRIARCLRCLFSALVLLPLLAACNASRTPEAAPMARAVNDPCRARAAADAPLRVVATTGQIGDVARLVAGQTQLAADLWSAEALTARTGWTPPRIEAPAGAAVQPTGLRITINTLLGPGTDPHVYVPSLGDATLLNEADVIFYNGLHLEAQMLKALEELARERCVVALGDRLYAEAQYRDLFIHSPDGVVDPHIWNEPVLWAAATSVIAATLDAAYGGEQAVLHANAQAAIARMESAGALIRAMFSADVVPVKYLVTAHDAFGYFAQLAQLESVGLQGLSTETEVSAYDIQATVDLIVEQRIPAIFVESSVSEDAIQAVRAASAARGWEVALGGELYSDALGPEGTEGATYLGMLQHNAVTVFQALAQGVAE